MSTLEAFDPAFSIPLFAEIISRARVVIDVMF
jgi:hypothetical protein